MRKRIADGLRTASRLLNLAAERISPWQPDPEAKARFEAAMAKFIDNALAELKEEPDGH